MNLNNIVDYLDIHESSPSALCLVKSVALNRDLSTTEVDDIYNTTAQADCDSEREQLLKTLTQDQLIILFDVITETLLEKLVNT